MVEKLQQRHCPMEPWVDDFFFFWFISQNEVVNRWDVATLCDSDCPSGFDHHRGERVSPGAHLVHCDGANWIDHPCVVAKAEDFLLGAVNVEFAVCLDQCSAPKVKGAQAVFNNISLKNGPSLAEKCLSQTFAVCQIRSGKTLESFSVTDGDEICFSNIRNGGNIRREVEVDGKRDKFVKR